MSGGDAFGAEGADLVLHEGDERGDDDGGAGEEECGELIGEGFASAGGEEGEGGVAVEEGVDGGFLTAAEGGVAEVVAEGVGGSHGEGTDGRGVRVLQDAERGLSQRVMKRILTVLIFAVPTAGMAVEAVTMEALTGGRPWKLAWLAEGGEKLMVLDPGGQVRELLGGQGRLARPLVTADGGAVVVTKLKATVGDAGTAYDPEMVSVPWTGGVPRSLGSGAAVAIWPGAGEEPGAVYAFAALETSKRAALAGEPLVKFRVEKPEDREIVWSGRAAAVDNFQVSRDGTRAAGLFPWPQAGLADLKAQTWTPAGHGAWPSLAPDDSYAMLLLDGTKRRLRCYVPEVDPGWDLDLAELPTLAGGTLNHPRWSNDAQILTFTGPWPEEGSGGEARVQALRLRKDLKAVEAVHVATVTTGAVESPDLWVANAGGVVTSLPQAPKVGAAGGAKAGGWPVQTDGLVLGWERLGGKNDPVLRGMAFGGPGGVVNVSAGSAEFPAAVSGAVFDAVRGSGAWSLSCMVTERRSVPPMSVRLVTLRNEDGTDAAGLYRVDGKLVLRVLTGGGEGVPARVERFVLTAMFIEDDRPFSLVVTCRNKRLACYVDGQLMREFTTEASGFGGWKAGQLVLGDERPYGGPWTGNIERVALYSRGLGQEEVEEAWKEASAMLTERTRPTRNLVKAKLVEWPELPAGEALKESANWLQASVWEIEQVFTGAVTDKRITRLHWAVLDGKPVPRPEVQVGQSMEFSIEPVTDHPETGAAKVHHAVTAGEAPVWFDATVPGRHKPPFPAP